MRTLLFCLPTIILIACTSTPASKDKSSLDNGTHESIKVMVLGTYHLAGSEEDVINLEVDSVLTPKRQTELEALAQSLKTFNPTVIVTERVTSAPDYLDPFFKDFEPEMLMRKSNERVQIAFRTAALASVERVYGIDEQPEGDEPDYFPFDKLMAHTGQTGQEDKFHALLQRFQTIVTKEQSKFSDMTISEALYSVNSGILSSADFYYTMVEFDQGETQPAAELQAYWFMRNAKIFSKLHDVARPGDRVLVVYGAGHKFWLDHFVENTPGFKGVDPLPYLEKPE